MSLLEACRIVTRAGFTPVNADAYARLRAWCDENGWPPKEWEPSGESSPNTGPKEREA